MEHLTIGRMAELNCVSERTLRVYDDKGLLVPAMRDEKNGYRYYSIEQCSTLDTIQYLKELGFSLDEIKEVIDRESVDYLSGELEKKEAEIIENMHTLRRALNTDRMLLDRCRLSSKRPEVGKLSIIELPERHVLRFDVENPEMLRSDLSGKETLEEWRLTVSQTKKQLIDKGLPSSLFSSVACVVPKESLERGEVGYSQAFIFLNDSDDACTQGAEVIPGGRYLVCYCNDESTVDEPLRENIYIERMLSYIKDNGLSIAGDYYGEVVLDSAIFGYGDIDMMVMMHIPIA